MKNLKTTLPYLSGFDSKGQQFVFIGGVCTPLNQEQADWILTNYPQVKEAEASDGGPATIQELKDYQATQTLNALDTTANVSESEQGKIKPGNSATMAAVVAGITPTQPTIKVPSASKK